MEYYDQQLAKAHENLRLAKQSRDSARLAGDSSESVDEDGLVAKMEERLREMEAAAHRSPTEAHVTAANVDGRAEGGYQPVV